MLLKRIEDELSGEIGSLVLKYQAIVQETCQQKSREILTTTIQRYAASHTAEIDREHGRYPQRRDEREDHRPRGA